MLEGIICPNCETPLNEEDLKEKLVCLKCKTDLKDRKYLDFLEYLMTNGIVENLDWKCPEVPLKVTIGIRENWYNKNGTVKKMDVANREKFLIDSIFKALKIDDRYIWEIKLTKLHSEDIERAIIDIEVY